MTKQIQKERSDGIMKGAFFLSVAGFLTKALSAFYKVPFQNLTGDEGFYVYQQVYPFYGIALALALHGLPLFVSKVVSEQKENDKKRVALKYTGISIGIFSVCCFFGLWFGSEWIAQKMGDIHLQPVIQMASYIFLCIPFLATIRGGFQGRLDMIPTSISQVGEQFVRVIVLLGVAYGYTQMNWSVYQMGTLAMSSTWIAGITGSLILLLHVRKAVFLSWRSPFKWKFLSLYGKRMLKEGLTITAMTSVMVFFQFIDSFTVYNGLMDSGLTEELAMVLKGAYDRGQPFVQLGMVVGLGFSTSFLPLLRQYHAEGKEMKWRESAGSVMKMTILFSGAAMVGLISVMPWLNEALFADQASTNVIRVYVISILFASLISCLHAILQSKGESMMAIVGLGSGLFFKLLMNRFAVRYVGTMGSSYISVLSLLIVCFFLASIVPKEVWEKGFNGWIVLKSAASFLVMLVTVSSSMYGLANLFSISGRLEAFLLVLAGVLVGCFVFLFCIIKMNLLTEKEQRHLPFSTHLKRIN